MFVLKKCYIRTTIIVKGLIYVITIVMNIYTIREHRLKASRGKWRKSHMTGPVITFRPDGQRLVMKNMIINLFKLTFTG